MRTGRHIKRDRQSGQAMMFTVIALAVTSAIGLVAITAVVRSLANEGSLQRQAVVERLAESASEEVFGRLAKSVSSLSAVTSHPGYSTGTDVGTASSVWVRYGTDGQVVTCTLGSQACFTVRLAAHGFTTAGVATADIDMATSAVIQVTARQCRESEISSAQVVARSASSPESKASCVYARRQTTIRSRLFSDHVVWVNTMANTKFATSDSIAGSIHLGTSNESFTYCGTPTIAKDTSVTPNVSYRIETLASTVVAVATSCTSTGSQVVSALTTASSDALALPVVSATDYASIANATISTAVTSPAAIVLSGSNYTLNGGSSTAIPSSGVLYVSGPATISQTTSLTGKLTIAASGDIAITSSLQLTSQVDDMLSIVSTAGNINISFSATSRTIEALLLAPSLTAGQGIVQTASTDLSSTPTYPLYLYGAIVARELGALGTITPETGATTAGYSKSFTYDSRLATSQPPYALSQVRGRWIRLAATTVSPFTPGVSGIATTTTAANTAPTVTFTSPATPSSSRTLSYTVTFSERISGLTSSEFSNTDKSSSCVFSIPNSYGITFTLTVVCSSDGTVIVQLAASSVIDNLGLTGPASASIASTVTISSVPTALAMETQPVGGESPTTFSTDAKIKLVNSTGDLVTTSDTTITVTASGGTLTGTTSMTTTGGYAEFTNLTLTASAGTYTLTFASSGLTSVTTASVTITVTAAAKLSTTTAASGSVSGVAFTTQPVITIQDASSNTVTNSTATVTASISSGTLIGTTTATAVNGVATFSNLGVTASAGTYTITYSSGALTTTSHSITVTVAVTCAAGGTCIVGDTGPGGGVVFYVQASGGTFTSTGSDCNTACKYFEAAPRGWGDGITVAAGETTGSSTVDPILKWCSNTTSLRNASTKTAIGDGRPNTTTSTNGVAACTSGAIYHADLYAGGTKTDWHLPSQSELNQMCKWQRGLAWVSDATVCSGGTLNSGTGASAMGFTTRYWSSTENGATYAWYQITDQNSDPKTVTTTYVRPVRAFG